MSTYVIGDIQGCYQALTRLLDKINFDEINDRLWFVGDIVNRGPNSLETLNFIIGLGESAITVLGNHDLYLLAASEGIKTLKTKDTLASILSSPKKEELSTWIRQRPLIHHDEALGFSMVHAGLHPAWEIAQALALAAEVSQVLCSDDYRSFIEVMYGNKPNHWDENLAGDDRLRFIINCLTRMRYLNNNNKLDFSAKGPPGNQGHDLIPWFAVAERKSRQNKIVFGHWSTVHLGNIQDFTPYNVYPVDTGYAWGRQLTALRLEDENLFSVAAN